MEALAIAMLAPDATRQQAARQPGWQMLTGVDYTRVRASCPLAYLESAYWRGVEAGVFPQD